MADEWIETALEEYEKIASLCNAQSLLGNTVSSSSSSSTVIDDGHENNDGRDLDPKRLTHELQQLILHDHLSNYYQEIDVVRKVHSSLKEQLLSLSKMQDFSDSIKYSDNGSNKRNIIHKHRQTPNIEAFSRHIELSERVIRTVMQSTPGQCGVLFENGLVRTSSSSDHEVNVVALAALRASVSQLKEKNGSGSG